MKRRNMRGDGERTREQELKYENKMLTHENDKLQRELKNLRRTNGRLEKQLAHLDLDRYSFVREMMQEHSTNEVMMDESKILEQMKREWMCHHCGKGHLEYITYPRPGGIWYRRECTLCDHGTKGQPYHPTVKGIKRTEIPR